MRVRAVEGMRPPTASDEHRLASLMYHAYFGTIDYEGEDETQALGEVRSTFSGEYGAFMWLASRVIEREGMLISAALLTRWQDKPFVAFSITRPEFQRRGFARACLMSAVNQLIVDGEHELRLAATLANVAAMGLYQSLGFRVQQ
jgi:ribosomal protein S18 acetylase RimI-like enzyme